MLASLRESLNALYLIGSHFGLPNNATYDYVIVGGGTAGLTVAARLAEYTNDSIAVIEAGSFYELDNGNRSEIPAFAVYGTGNDPSPSLVNPAVDWEQYTTPQAGFQNKPVFYPQGRTLGGGSARNYQCYQRGTVGSYQQWADAVGDESYTFENLLPYFKRSVDFHPADPAVLPTNISIPAGPGIQSAFEPGAGPLQVSYNAYTVPMFSWVQLAMRENGIPDIDNVESGSLLGNQIVPVTQDPRSQTRDSSETSFLRRALTNTTNLAVFTHTMAKQITFDQNKRATGVMVSSAGRNFTLSANKEIILSAGAMRSPQMLMVSGIGPKATLDEYGIPVVAELPGVGQNMWDHVLLGTSWRVNVPTASALSNAVFAADAVEKFNTNRTGPLTSNAGLLAWEKLPAPFRENLTANTRASFDTEFPSDWPEVEYLYINGYLGNQSDSALGAPKDPYQYASIAAAIVAPFSRGNVTIASADSSINPIVNPNWLGDPRDQELAVQMFKRTRDLFAARAIQPVLIGSEAYPGMNVSTDEQILQYIRTGGSKLHHVAASCQMGRMNDTMAVIDSRARVMGVSSLRVVDASAFPLLPPGHPQATIYALAEKIAADIAGVE